MTPVRHLSHFSTRVVSPTNNDDASTLELSLVTLALVTSAVLDLIPSTRRQGQNNVGRPSLFITISSLFFAAVALTISFVALGLGWGRIISLDALATVVFGLIPALLSMPLENLEYAWFRLRMARFKSLSKTYSSFTYVSFEPACNLPMETSKGYGTFRYGKETNKILYIRYFPKRKFFLGSEGDKKSIHYKSSRKETISAQSPNSRRRGYCLGHHKHYLVLQNFNKVSEVRWFRAVSTSTSMIARPWLVYLNTSNAAYQALAVLSDIIAFGRLVLKHRREYFEKQVTKFEAVQKGLKRTEGVICRAILNEVGLTEWGKLEKDVSDTEYQFPSERCKQYGLMFAVITIHSMVFGEKHHGISTRLSTLERTRVCRTNEKEKENDNENSNDNDEDVKLRVSTQNVLSALTDFDGNADEFENKQKSEVDRWLGSWGCDPVAVPSEATAGSDYAGSDEVHGEA